jgi:hypothetical protein
MLPERYNISHPAFKMSRRLGHPRWGNNLRWYWGQTGLDKLIDPGRILDTRRFEENTTVGGFELNALKKL